MFFLFWQKIILRKYLAIQDVFFVLFFDSKASIIKAHTVNNNHHQALLVEKLVIKLNRVCIANKKKSAEYNTYTLT